MKELIILTLYAFGHIQSSHVPLGVTIGLSPYSHPVSSQYHAQDNYGQYVYGYATPTSAKSEAKTADGVTHGGYSYIDSNGILQSVQYVADSVHGFRVAATNLPRDLPDVALAKAKHLADYAQVQAEHAQIAARTVQYSNPIAVPVSAVPHVNIVQLPQPVQDLPEVVKARAEHLAAVKAVQLQTAKVVVPPQPVQDLPEVIKARAEHLAAVEATKARDFALSHAASLSPIPQEVHNAVVPVHTSIPSTYAAPVAAVSYAPTFLSSQYHAQDDLGQYSYGYVGSLSSKAETKTADGVTHGGYSYIDANGVLQTVNYVSDPVNGFRVAATNLPVAPKVHLIPPGQTVVQTTGPVVAKETVAGKTIVPGLYTQEVYY